MGPFKDDFSIPNILNILPSSEKVYPLSSAVAIDFSAFEIASYIDPTYLCASDIEDQCSEAS